ncbi:uncharacterized protein LOC119577082 [Penaeus monodon]|uniref:uncharacterized protein LOC119577082 n=1 Tax=Penaeus monodon TaxID=6687 RepID=UPI0018A7DFC3|nr:uncharacterized protein LOC119577082 [Penaeus monodon]
MTLSGLERIENGVPPGRPRGPRMTRGPSCIQDAAEDRCTSRASASVLVVSSTGCSERSRWRDAERGLGRGRRWRRQWCWRCWLELRVPSASLRRVTGKMNVFIGVKTRCL